MVRSQSTRLRIGLALAAFSLFLAIPTIQAQAVCGTALNCPSNSTVTAVLLGEHKQDAQLNPKLMEPQHGVTWTITARYASDSSGVSCVCDVQEYNAEIEIDWNSATGQWGTTTCTGCAAAPFNQVVPTYASRCTNMSGPANVYHSYSYYIRAELNKLVTLCSRSYHLYQVLFVTNGVDDALEYLDTDAKPCQLDIYCWGPNSATYNAADNGPYECGWSTTATGAQRVVQYNLGCP